MIFLSPTEHELRKHLTTLDVRFQNSALCEANGVDCIVPTKAGLIGYQRKTLPDLFASLQDGRIARELAQIRGSSLLRYGILVIEFDDRRTTSDGSQYLDAPLSRDALRHLLLKCQANGILSFRTENLADTARSVLASARYLGADKSSDLLRPKPTTDSWGSRTSRDWGIHVLQSFSSIGPVTAGAIFDCYGIPLTWTITEADLMTVPGVGKITASRLIAALRSGESSPPKT